MSHIKIKRKDIHKKILSYTSTPYESSTDYYIYIYILYIYMLYIYIYTILYFR